MTKELEKKDKKIMLVNKSAFSTRQVLHMLQKTPKDHVYQRPAKGGGQWDYVTGTYVKKTLNYAFGWMWSSEVKEIMREADQVVVLVRLTIQDPAGVPVIWKEDIGKKDIMFRKGTKDPLDYGNDVKSAVTDGLKRCAAQLGIASDIYGKEEFREIKADDFVNDLIDERLDQPADENQKETIRNMLTAQGHEVDYDWIDALKYVEAAGVIKQLATGNYKKEVKNG